MSTTEIAAALHGSEYPLRITRVIAAAAKSERIVIVYGASDDLMVFDGAIHDDIGAFEGTVAYLTPTGLLANDCDNDDCPHFARAKKHAATIEAIFSPDDSKTWAYKTTIPHQTFDVMEDGQIYCTGIVFALADVPAAIADAMIVARQTTQREG